MTKASIIAVATLLSAAVLGTSPGMGQCMSGRDAAARQAISQGQAVPLAVALNRAGLSSDQVAGAELCKAGGGYVYRVHLRQGGTRDIPAN
jgi:hypothetical protein